jgi:hypothetical protein
MAWRICYEGILRPSALTISHVITSRTSINVQLQMIGSAIPDSYGSTTAVSIKMIQLNLFQIRFSMDAIPTHVRWIIYNST